MKKIKLTQSQFAIVDNKNYKWLIQWKWCALWHKDTQSFYAVRNGKTKDGKKYIISMAREILRLKYGDNKRYSDHINHNTLDNRELNLRVVTHQQNNWNQKNVKGYSWNKRRRKYQARIGVDGKLMALGYFETPEKAHNAYLKAKKKYHKMEVI